LACDCPLCSDARGDVIGMSDAEGDQTSVRLNVVEERPDCLLQTS
jgi:hypothetical protein